MKHSIIQYKRTEMGLVLLLLTLFLLPPLTASAQDYVWAESIGGTGNDEGRSITVDDQGNVYTTGFFQGTVDFDPGEGEVEFTSGEGGDIFISKLDAMGDFVWAKHMGGIGAGFGRSITVDNQGNVYTTGDFEGTVDFNPSDGIDEVAELTSAENSKDIFISKLDTDGNYLWAKSMGGATKDFGHSLAVDGQGNVYTTGYFEGTVDFDPGDEIDEVAELTSVENSRDIFISKLDTSGDFIWVKGIGGAGADFGQSIAVDDQGNIYITGLFQNAVDFDLGEGTVQLTSDEGSVDIFIYKLDTSGDFLWAKSMGGGGTDVGLSLAVDGQGNVYTTGFFDGTVDFDPGVETVELISAGNTDFFISKLDTNGTFMWAKGMGGTGTDNAESLAVDGQGNIYITGFFRSTVDFDPGTGTVELISVGDNGSPDIFIAKLNADGNFVSVKSMGGAASDRGYSLVVNDEGNVYITGYFEGTADFDPDAGTADLIAAGDNGSPDIFIAKYCQTPTTPEVIIDQPTCDVATGTITVTEQVADETYSFDNGANFQAENAKSGLEVGTYEVIIMSAGGCSSVATQAVVNTQPVTPAAPVTTLTQPTCDVATGTITVTEQVADDTYSFDNGATFQTDNFKSGLATGTYEVIIKNACGSSIAAQAVVNAPPIIPATPEITITQPTCEVATGTITVTAQNEGEIYSFDNGVNFQEGNSISDLAAGTYEVIIKSTGECSSVAIQAVVDAQPTVPTTPEITSITQPTCAVATGTITVTQQIAGETYSFNNGATFQAENAKSGLEVGTYGVIIKSADGCSSVTVQAAVDAQPVTPAKPEITSNIDDPKAHVLTSSNASGNQWYLNEEPIAEATNATLTVTGAGEYTVQTILGNCTSEFSNPFSIEDQTITFEAIADQILEAASTLTLGATASSGLEVSYKIVSGPATVAANVVTFTNPGIVTVSASQIGNDTFFAATEVEQSFEVITVTSVEKNLATTISFYPNPASNYMTIQSRDQLLQVEILDMSGKQMMIENNVQLDISKLKAGNYLLKVTTVSEVYVNQFIKQ